MRGHHKISFSGTGPANTTGGVSRDASITINWEISSPSRV